MSAVESASVPSQSKTMQPVAPRRELSHVAPSATPAPERATNAARSAGSGDSSASRSPVARMREARAARACRNMRFRPCLARAPCSTRSRRTCRRPRAESRDASGARGSGACARCRSSASSSASGGSCARPHVAAAGTIVCACWPVVARRARAARLRASTKLVQRQLAPRASRRATAAHEHEVALVDLAVAQLRRAARPARARFLATSSTPDVSRSSRWTSSRKRRLRARARAAARSRRTRCRCRRGPRGRPACRARSARRPRTGSASVSPGARRAGRRRRGAAPPVRIGGMRSWSPVDQPRVRPDALAG